MTLTLFLFQNNPMYIANAFLMSVCKDLTLSDTKIRKLLARIIAEFAENLTEISHLVAE